MASESTALPAVFVDNLKFVIELKLDENTPLNKAYFSESVHILGTAWRVGLMRKIENKIAIYLYMQTSGKITVSGFQMTLDDQKNEEKSITLQATEFEFNDKTPDIGYGFNIFTTFEVMTSVENGFYLDGKVNITIKLLNITKWENLTHLPLAIPSEQSTEVVNTNLPTLLYDESTSDCVLIVENSKIHAHKWLLSIYSPVFKTMFETHMREGTTSEVIISDFSEQTVRSLLRCLYAYTINIGNELMI